MDELSIRETRMEDLIQLESLFREELDHHRSLHPDRFSDPEETITESWLKRALEAKEGSLLVAEHRRNLVGVIHIMVIEEPGDAIMKARRYGYLNEMVVTQRYRRQGVGTRLLDHAMEVLRNQGLTRVELDLWENNHPGRGLYSGYGFSPLRRRIGYRLDD